MARHSWKVYLQKTRKNKTYKWGASIVERNLSILEAISYWKQLFNCFGDEYGTNLYPKRN